MMARPVSGVGGKGLEIKFAIRAADKFRPPRLKIVHHVNYVVDPNAGEVGIDELAVPTPKSSKYWVANLQNDSMRRRDRSAS